MDVTRLVFQGSFTWPEKDEANANIPYIDVTRPVSHVDKFPLNDDALWNTQAILVTLLVSQDERFLLKREADSNMPYMD